MPLISRNPTEAAGRIYDLIIVGGGVYGAMLLLEAQKSGLSALLLEKNDFGGATSFNSLRIVHGGLRYLQTMDLPRFRESVRERRWFLSTFPDLVYPLSCLMPLYGSGLKRPYIFRMALHANDMFSHDRNRGVPPDRWLEAGHLIGPEETKGVFPQVDYRGLKGSAVWFDAAMPDSHRIIIEVIRWASELGGTALNYVSVDSTLESRGRVAGVVAVDTAAGITYEFQGKSVVNAAGPWSREFASRAHSDIPVLFSSSIAWNVLFSRPAISKHALAVAPKRKKSQIYFIHPWKDKLLIGTGHAPAGTVSDNPHPTPDQIEVFIQDINQTIPGLDLTEHEIITVLAGQLPVLRANSTRLTTREQIVDHKKLGGPEGLYSVSGVKFTTARLVAEKTIRLILKRSFRRQAEIQSDQAETRQVQNVDNIFHKEWNLFCGNDEAWKTCLEKLIETESVVHLDDLLLRRINLIDTPARLYQVVEKMPKLINWRLKRWDEEIARLAKIYPCRGEPPWNDAVKVKDLELS